jgi:uncharacterized membrane protein YhaH (DUF805 family)
MPTDPSCTVAPMSWYQWYPTVLRRYAVFDGRADRPEFWWFQLDNLIVLAVIWAFLLVTGASRAIVDIYWLAVFLPSLGVQIRRLHDTDRSGWWVLFGLIPIVGVIFMIVWLASEGSPGPNRFGASPRGDVGSATSFGGQGYDPAAATGSPGGESSRYCARCGSPLAAGATYCGNCGAPVA